MIVVIVTIISLVVVSRMQIIVGGQENCPVVSEIFLAVKASSHLKKGLLSSIPDYDVHISAC